jgi:hypothetical protein
MKRYNTAHSGRHLMPQILVLGFGVSSKCPSDIVHLSVSQNTNSPEQHVV